MMKRICLFVILSLLLSLCFAEDSKDGAVCGIAPASKSAPHNFSVCTMVCNEAKNIEEWIAYHLLIKVDHFYIYDDKSTDNLADVLAPYIKLGLVTLIPWDENHQTVYLWMSPEEPEYTRKQRLAIGDCMHNYQNESKWFGVFDIDEFLVVNRYWPDIQAFLPYISANADDYHVPVTIFGTSGHSKTPTGSVLQNFQMRSSMTIFGNNPVDNRFNGKSIYKSGCGMPNVHFSNSLRPGCWKYTGGWISLAGAGHKLPLSMHHYPVKSWEQFQEKMAKWRLPLYKEDFDKYEATTNKVWDNSMERFVWPISELIKCMRKN